MHGSRLLVTGGLVLSVSLGLWTGIAWSDDGHDHAKKGKADPKAAVTAKEREKADIAAQKNCVVSNKSLGSMGAPIKVTVKDQLANEQDVYLCCQGCVAKVKKEPDEYLAKLPQKAEGQKKSGLK